MVDTRLNYSKLQVKWYKGNGVHTESIMISSRVGTQVTAMFY
jgi:hypothetical protein